MMKEYGDIENDLKTVQSICKYKFLFYWKYLFKMYLY